jgi:hypothetical protein
MGVVQGSIPCKSSFLPLIIFFLQSRFVGSVVVLRWAMFGKIYNAKPLF